MGRWTKKEFSLIRAHSMFFSGCWTTLAKAWKNDRSFDSLAFGFQIAGIEFLRTQNTISS